MAWSNETTYKFIELYQSEPSIWNPRSKHHKDKSKVSDAWDRISEDMDVSVRELKKKKETLMAAFRLNHKKKLASLKTGCAEEDTFKPIWIFYEPMASFLADVYDCRSSSNTDDSASTFSNFQDKWNPIIEVGVEEVSNDGESSQYTRPSPAAQKRRHSQMGQESHLCDSFISHAMSTVTNIISTMHKNRGSDEDECDIYSRLLAKKLRRLQEFERLELMYEIDSLFLQKRIKLEPGLSSPDFN